MAKYLDPLSDIGFKKLFGEESSKEVLISFLNEVLRPEGVDITNIRYLKNERISQHQEDRRAFFDLFCTDASGSLFIVEVQRRRSDFFKDRALYYATFPIRDQAQTGPWNFRLMPVYVIAVLEFMLPDEESDGVITFSTFMNRVSKKRSNMNLTFVYIELPRFKKKESGLETLLDKWLFLAQQ